MYDRALHEQTLEFETSGGLLEASLVMRDRQTDSWWSIMQGTAIDGALQGESLQQLPGAEKTTWGDWRRRHPQSLVLSVDGEEHVSHNPYSSYFDSPETFRDTPLRDSRLPAKEPIFAFPFRQQRYAVPHARFAGGALFDLAEGETQVFLFRPAAASVVASSQALLVPPGLVQRQNGGWRFRSSLEADWDAARPVTTDADLAALAAVDGVQPLLGFDTFWYNYVGVHPHTRILR